jgi:PQQ-like domain
MPIGNLLRAAALKSLRAGALTSACLLICACGSSSGNIAGLSTLTAPPGAIPHPAHAAAAPLSDWPEFGLDPQRSDSSERASGITSANVAHLHRRRVALPGIVDSSPIYLRAALVGGGAHETIVVTTTYGKTLAIDARTGRILWTFTPPGYDSWLGSAQFTTASPLADPNGRFVYAASPNGLIHKLALADGAEDRSGAWPVKVTRDPTKEKLGAALNIDGPDLLVATSGYFGDTPPYLGHVLAIDRSSGAIRSIFNTLCANRRALILPNSCPASDSAILSRGGVVVEPGGRRVLIDTGNGPWNGRTDFGDSVLELTFPRLDLRQSFTPVDEEHLNTTDTDLGSSAPALVGRTRVLIGSKDGILRLLALSRLNGRSKPDHTLLGGELQRLPLPGGGELFTAPAVWRDRGRTIVFLGDEHATAAYVLRRGRLYLAWQNATPGTSPVMAGGLLYVYDPAAGGINVYRPGSPKPIAKLPGAPGHWNSPIVAAGHVVEPEGDAYDHRASGTLEIFSAR